MEYQNVTVTIPVTRIGDLLAFAAELARAEADEEQTHTAAARPMSPAAVRAMYLGGKSVHWRPFIDVLVSRPGRWVEWEELCEIIGLRPSQAAGMLGAAERRCGQRPPYEKSLRDGKIHFRVGKDIADIIQALIFVDDE